MLPRDAVVQRGSNAKDSRKPKKHTPIRTVGPPTETNNTEMKHTKNGPTQAARARNASGIQHQILNEGNTWQPTSLTTKQQTAPDCSPTKLKDTTRAPRAQRPRRLWGGEELHPWRPTGSARQRCSSQEGQGGGSPTRARDCHVMLHITLLPALVLQPAHFRSLSVVRCHACMHCE